MARDMFGGRPRRALGKLMKEIDGVNGFPKFIRFHKAGNVETRLGAMDVRALCQAIYGSDYLCASLS